MPYFTYEAVNETGKKIKGTLQAADKQAAIQELRGMKLSVRGIRERKIGWLHREIHIGSPVKMKDFVVFCRQFATLIRAGIQLDQALDVLEDQASGKTLKQAIRDIRQQVLAGSQLSEAMKQHPNVFPDMFVNMVMSGEVGGQLDDVLERMATHYEKEHRTMQKVKSAMTYPAIVLVLAVGVVIFMLAKVVPTFAGMFADQGLELPLVTKIVMGASDFVTRYWWILLLGLAAAVLGFQLAFAGEQGKYMLDKLKFNLPLFGIVLRKAAIARLSRVMASLHSGGVPLIEALTVSARAAGNRVVRKVLEEARQSLAEGRQLSKPFRESGLFPKMVTSMLVIGEETGQLDTMFGKIADFYEDDVDKTVDQLKASIEPMLLLVVSTIVGIIIAAMMTPMFKLYENFL